MTECDIAYDKAKSMLRLMELKEKSSKAPSSKKEEVKKPAPVRSLHLTLDTKEARLSHILQIKQIFRSHAGDSPISLDFLSDAHKMGTLSISSTWGVRIDGELEKKIRQVPSVLSVKSV